MKRPWWKRGVVAIAALILVVCARHIVGTGVEEEAGVTHNIQKVSESDIFTSVDADGDGTLGRSELQAFIDESIGGSEFDDEKEIHYGAHASLDAINTNGVSGIQTNELRDHWNYIAATLTIDGVAEWIEHGVALPQYADAFRENAINGFDLPSVLEDENYWSGCSSGRSGRRPTRRTADHVTNVAAPSSDSEKM